MKNLILIHTPKFWGYSYFVLAFIVFPICYIIFADHFYYSTLTKEVIFNKKMKALEACLLEDVALEMWRGSTSVYLLTKDGEFDKSLIKRRGKDFSLFGAEVKNINIFNDFLIFDLQFQDQNTDSLHKLISYHFEECRIKFNLPDIIEKKNEYSNNLLIPIEIEFPTSAKESWKLKSAFRDITGNVEILSKLNNSSRVETETIKSKFFNPTKIIKISYNTLTQLKELYKLHLNIPINFWKITSRACYLSLVTITTLGYGDIVPITDWARTLISLESFMGVVIMGFFLNSIGNKK